jgi:hypothetical protein
MGCVSSEPSYVTQVVLGLPASWKALSDTLIYDHIFQTFMGPDMMKLSDISNVTSAVYVPGGEITNSVIFADLPMTAYRERQRLSNQAIRFVDHIAPGVHVDSKIVLSNSICHQTYDVHLNRTEDHLQMRIVVEATRFNANRASAIVEMTKKSICRPAEEHRRMTELYKGAMMAEPIAHMPQLRQQILLWWKQQIKSTPIVQAFVQGSDFVVGKVVRLPQDTWKQSSGTAIEIEQKIASI